MKTLSIMFPRQDEAFAATRKAERYLRDRGFSIGTMCYDEPRGIMLGQLYIAKWINIDAADRRAFHGTLTGEGRYGPVSIKISDAAPEAVKTAFLTELEIA